MKKRLIISFGCFIVMASLPFVATGGRVMENAKTERSQISTAVDEKSLINNNNSTVSESYESENQSFFKILDESTGNVVIVDDKTFCYGAVAAEMLPSFEQEALKAQCVACYTHFCNLRNKQRENPNNKLKGADFSADLSKNQYYMSNETMKELWGNLYDESYDNIKTAVDDVFGQVLTDENGELITVAYHAISGGTTEAFVDVFGEDLSYLKAVSSPGDLLAPGYMSKKSLSEKDFKNKILAENDNADLSKAASKWIGDLERTKSGMVKSIKIGGEDFSGIQLRELFDLRSADFDIEYSKGKFNFTVRGYGHGVGMSQYGAEYMAQQGSDYKEILAWYYKNTKIIKT